MRASRLGCWHNPCRSHCCNGDPMIHGYADASPVQHRLLHIQRTSLPHPCYQCNPWLTSSPFLFPPLGVECSHSYAFKIAKNRQPRAQRQECSVAAAKNLARAYLLIWVVRCANFVLMTEGATSEILPGSTQLVTFEESDRATLSSYGKFVELKANNIIVKEGDPQESLRVTLRRACISCWRV
jgi:hypothetical protein